MTILEKVAKEAFEAFCHKNNIHGITWAFLQKERKVDWMQDCLVIYNSVIQDLKSSIRPVAPVSQIDGSYLRGYNDGMRQERLKYADFLHNLQEDLKEQLQDTLNPPQEKILRRGRKIT